jgi:SAM-dependent methyltransferase
MAQAISEWVLRWAPLVGRGPVLDLACGDGRHSRYFLGKGFEVHAVDRDPRLIEGVRFLQADLENGAPWPLAGQRFGAIVVTNYLYRPLFAVIAQSLAADGVLIYETFMVGNEKLGRPSNPDFLLKKGELLEVFADLQVIAFEQGLVERPKPAVIQRLCAIRGDSGRVRIGPHDYR